MRKNKIVKIGFISSLLGLTLFITMCKKNSETLAPLHNTRALTSQTGRLIQSPNYNLTTEQVVTLIKNFKNDVANRKASKSSTLTPNDTVSLDSAQYLLEATLNFDFDEYIDSTLEISVLEQNFDFETSHPDDTELTTESLNDAYEDMYEYIESTYSDGAIVACLDVQAIIDGDNKYFKLTVFKGKNMSITNFCETAPYTTNNMYPPIDTVRLRFEYPNHPIGLNGSSGLADLIFIRNLQCDPYFDICLTENDHGFFYSTVNPHAYYANINDSTEVNLYVGIWDVVSGHTNSLHQRSGSFFNTAFANINAMRINSLLTGEVIVYHASYVFVGYHFNNPNTWCKWFWHNAIWSSGKKHCRSVPRE